LLAIVRVKATALRNGKPSEVPAGDIVPGDVVLLHAGDAVPGDCLILESTDFSVDESVLTGETYPAEKQAGTLPVDTLLARRNNCAFLGTHVSSGTATALVVRTGRSTEFGAISEHLRLRPPETEFERGVRRFSYFLMEITLVLVIAIFAVNVFFRDHAQHPVLQAFMFSLALAVGLTPQLLPAIISVNLAHGARKMAENQVIVRRLPAIENFGSMNVLCSDKTGTITEGVVRVHSAVDAQGQDSEKTFLYAHLNSSFETGFANPIDEAIRAHKKLDVRRYRKLGEIPYDFIRKRLTVLVAEGSRHFLTTKGALSNVLSVCDSAETGEGRIEEIAVVRQAIDERFKELSAKGFRTLGVAYRDVGERSSITRDDESTMTFLGILVLFDPPKAGIQTAIETLKLLGVSLKIITGDNHLVAAHLADQIGAGASQVLTGAEIRQLSDGALLRRVTNTDVFAEIEPNQKERIVLALKKSGNVVGYMGDGINDVSALHVADVSISVDTAVDVAKDAADIVLLARDLEVLARGVREGRATFANTLKYVFMATSANFGNMFSMAGASLFLPFLPLLPKQVLLMNLMTDFPEMSIATDRVDHEWIERPKRWDIGFIRKFMLTFGILSSVFDYLTFGVLLLILHATTSQFRTGWFVESVASASLIVLVIRSRRSLGRSRPSKYLLAATLLVIAATVVLPFTPLGRLLGFCPLPAPFWCLIATVVLAYIVAAEFMKRWFYRHVAF
jgi:Mg2+-importing ATPase